MVRRVRNPGSGKPSHNGPSNGPGYGGPAKGAGWGREKSGSVRQELKPFGPDNPAPPRHRTPEELAARKLELAGRVDEYLDMWHEIACNRKEYTGNRMAAMEKAANRIEGTPVARNVNVNTDDVSHLSDDELRAELERISRAAGQAAAGNEAPGSEERSPSVH